VNDRLYRADAARAVDDADAQASPWRNLQDLQQMIGTRA